MTLHAAKGLEFDVVFLPGWEEGLFPHQRSLDDNGLAGLEEERRLAYVGLTRARRQARVSYAFNRRVRGLWQTSAPSRFIQELPADHVEFEEFAGAGADRAYGWPSAAPEAGPASRYDTPGWRRAEARSREASGENDEDLRVRFLTARSMGLVRPPRSFTPGRGCFTANSVLARLSLSTAPS